MDRRALFLLGAAVVCAVLIPVTESEHQWVPIGLSIDLRVAGIGVVGRRPRPAAAQDS